MICQNLDLASRAGAEPRLGDMLEDPIVIQLMRRDGVDREDLLDLLDAARLRLRLSAVPVQGAGWMESAGRSF